LPGAHPDAVMVQLQRPRVCTASDHVRLGPAVVRYTCSPVETGPRQTATEGSEGRQAPASTQRAVDQDRSLDALREHETASSACPAPVRHEALAVSRRLPHTPLAPAARAGGRPGGDERRGWDWVGDVGPPRIPALVANRNGRRAGKDDRGHLLFLPRVADGEWARPGIRRLRDRTTRPEPDGRFESHPARAPCPRRQPPAVGEAGWKLSFPAGSSGR
jgi:hypothetical protein